MKTAATTTKDPICGMTVNTATAIHAERDGQTYYFCGQACRTKFAALPPGKLLEPKSGGCCG